MGEERLIIRSERVRFIDILSMLLLRRPVTGHSFVDAGDHTVRDIGVTPGDVLVLLTQIIQKALAAAYYPAKMIGAIVEFVLNFLALNGGLLGIIWNIFRCKLVIPHREAPNFRSMIGMIDGRTELKPAATSDSDMRLLEVMDVSSEDLESGERDAAAPLIGQQYPALEVSVMSAKIASENAAYIEDVVNNVWKFNFVGYYSCWDKFLQLDSTQAFVMTDKKQDASVVVVAFRGTEPFNMLDWSTDVNLSWLGMGAMGHVHVGFLKALGLQEEDGADAERAFPRALPNGAAPAGKAVAYYRLREQLRRHPGAKEVVTGHSLGGALAAVFPALHGETYLLSRLAAVHTFGQPRVGDGTLAAFVRASVPATFLRVVYRYDVVPRVPFDCPPVAEFAHGGTCVYYDGWYGGRVLAGDAPNPNYFDPRYQLSMYANAWGDLLKAMFLGVTAGSDYREGPVSLLYRATGLLLPGVASHSPRDYVNAVRLGHIAPKQV